MKYYGGMFEQMLNGPFLPYVALDDLEPRIVCNHLQVG